MKNWKKRFTSLLLTIVMCLTLGIPALASNTDNTDNVSREVAYNWALSVGYPADLLDSLSDEVLFDVYRMNKDEENIEVSYSVGYYSVAGNHLTRGNIDSSDLTFRLSCSRVSSVDKIVKYVYVISSYEWTVNQPDFKLDDAITVNWDESLWGLERDSSSKVTNFKATFSGKVKRTGEDEVYATLDRPAKTNRGGIGWYVEQDTDKYTYPHGTATFKLLPVDTQLMEGRRYRSFFTSTYAHEIAKVSSISLSTSAAGVTISGSYNEAAATNYVYYDVSQ